MLAVIDQVADDVVTLIAAAWSPIAPNAVAAVDLPFAELESIVGIQVWVFAADYSDNAPITRGEDEADYTVAVVVASRWPNQGDPTKVWIRSMRSFVEQKIYNVLTEPRTVQLAVTTAAGTGYLWPQRVDVVQSYDPAMLREKKLFWCDMEVTFRGNLTI